MTTQESDAERLRFGLPPIHCERPLTETEREGRPDIRVTWADGNLRHFVPICRDGFICYVDVMQAGG